MSQREAARHFGISRDSVRKMLSFSVPPGYRRSAPVRRPKLDGFTEIIEQWLREDLGQRGGLRSRADETKGFMLSPRDTPVATCDPDRQTRSIM